MDSLKSLSAARRWIRRSSKNLRPHLFEISLLFCITLFLYLAALTFFLKTVVIFFRS